MYRVLWKIVFKKELPSSCPLKLSLDIYLLSNGIITPTKEPIEYSDNYHTSTAIGNQW